MAAVKKSVNKRFREYDARSRTEQAQRKRQTVLDVAERAFLSTGYAETTIAAIAREANVSVETIYKAFGGKAGLVRALYYRGLEGRGPVPAPQRSDAISASETDPVELVRKWGAFTAEVSPIVSPLLLLVRTAAASDPDLAALLCETDQQRLDRMRHNANKLAVKGFLRADVNVETAADVMWMCTSPELYDLLVMRRRWTPAQLGDFVAKVLEAGLLAEGESH
jgi:AcrR family transcriptional regulator